MNSTNPHIEVIRKTSLLEGGKREKRKKGKEIRKLFLLIVLDKKIRSFLYLNFSILIPKIPLSYLLVQT